MNCNNKINTTTKKVTRNGPKKDFRINESVFFNLLGCYAPIISLSWDNRFSQI